MVNVLDLLLHSDVYLQILIQTYGVLTYLFLSLVIFLETGLVIAPFLPGDSLLFIAGAFAARGALNIFLLFFLLSAAAIVGDSVNYWIGSYFGEKAFSKMKLFKPEYLEKTKGFYERHGGKTIIFARFIPIVRTFAPFVAGIGKMDYIRFISFNFIGGILWVALFLFTGFFFGGIPIVEKNLTWIIIGIIILSIIPPIIEYLRNKRKR